MEIRPERGVTLVPFPGGKFALVMVEIIGPVSAREIADALTAKRPHAKAREAAPEKPPARTGKRRIA